MIWSKSKLKCMSQCSWQFKLAYIDLIKVERKHEDLEKGTILHDVFDKFYEKFDKDKSITEIMEALLDEKKISKDFREKYKDHIINFNKFNEEKFQQYPEAFLPVYRETWYEIGNLHGFIDRIDCINGEYILIDYKTSIGSSSITEYMDELIIYAWLFQQTTGKEISYAGIYFSGNNHLTLKKIDQQLIKDVIEGVFAEIELNEMKIKNKDFEAKPGFYCRWCSYQDRCPIKGINKGD